MSEQALSGGGPGADHPPVCPWCSAELPSADAERCPSCGASLGEAAPDDVPGLTRVDHEALLKARAGAPRSRGLLGWLSGDYQGDAEPGTPATVEPPSNAVRREMLRMELEALQAELRAREAEALAESGAVPAGEAGDDGTPAAEDPVASALEQDEASRGEEPAQP